MHVHLLSVKTSEERKKDLCCASLVTQMVKSPSAMQETQVRALGQEDALEKEIGNPLQYSCLGDPIDGGV